MIRDNHLGQSIQMPVRQMSEVHRRQLDFIADHTGFMAEMIRHQDWNKSPLGPPSRWPESLKSALSLMLDSEFPMFLAWDHDLGFLYNDAYSAILGAKHPKALGRPFKEIWQEIWPDILPLIEQALAGKATWLDDLPLTMNRHGYDEETWFTFSYSPLRDEDGRVCGLFCACTETTDKVRAIRNNQAERQRLENLFAQAPGFMAMLTGPEHTFELTNASYRRLIGDRDVIGRRVSEVLPELQGQGFFELLDQVYRTGEPFVGHQQSMRIRRRSGGQIEQTYLDFIYQPVKDSAGTVTGIFAEGYDVTDQKLAQEQQTLLINELNHRVKNTLAIVQGLAQQTFTLEVPTPVARKVFDARLKALALAHDLLTRQNWKAAKISDILSSGVEATAGDAAKRVSYNGPDVTLPPQTAVSFAMAVHELSTNAVKYGSLSNDTGIVSVSWTINSAYDQMRLNFEWQETGGPDVAPPKKTGFGTRMIQHGLAAELHGTINLEFAPTGVRYTIDAPLPRVEP